MSFIVYQSEINSPHIEQKCRYRCESLQVDQAQTIREVTLSGPNKKQPACLTNEE